MKVTQFAGYILSQDYRETAGFPSVVALPSVFPSIRRAITRLTLNQEIVVGREVRRKGTLYKPKEEKAGLGVKTMDKVSLATKVHLF